MTFLHEATGKLKIGGYVVRYWKPIKEGESPIDVKQAIAAAISDRGGIKPTDEDAKMLIGKLGLNAVEIVDGSGTGIVTYADWP